MTETGTQLAVSYVLILLFSFLMNINYSNTSYSDKLDTLILKDSARILRDSLKWYDVSQMSKSGRIANTAIEPYLRLPDTMKVLVTKEVWDLAMNTAGMYLEFQSNAGKIQVIYQIEGEVSMNHMAATGVSGIDLYYKSENGSWNWLKGNYQFADTIRYTYNNIKPTNIIDGYYRLYLPLYSKLKWMRIGVAEKDIFYSAEKHVEKPIIIYGTSIVQGACASRPGMAWPSILSREIDRDIINLGFSGNGKLEKSMIEMIANQEAGAFILDCMPNLVDLASDTLLVKKRIISSVLKIREKQSKVPIILVEHSGYSQAILQDGYNSTYTNLNLATKMAYKDLLNLDLSSIYIITKENLNLNMDCYVDGTHPNDIGMKRYATVLGDLLLDIQN